MRNLSQTCLGELAVKLEKLSPSSVRWNECPAQWVLFEAI